MPEIGNAYKISIKKTVKERACMEHIGIYRRIILQQILMHRVGRCGQDSPSFVQGPVAFSFFIYY
jgi:hypothetical protein